MLLNVILSSEHRCGTQGLESHGLVSRACGPMTQQARSAMSSLQNMHISRSSRSNRLYISQYAFLNSCMEELSKDLIIFSYHNLRSTVEPHHLHQPALSIFARDAKYPRLNPACEGYTCQNSLTDCWLIPNCPCPVPEPHAQ